MMDHEDALGRTTKYDSLGPGEFWTTLEAQTQYRIGLRRVAVKLQSWTEWMAEQAGQARSPHGPAHHGRHHGRGAAGGGGGEGAPVAAVVVVAAAAVVCGVFRSRRALLALVDPEALFPCLEASG